MGGFETNSFSPLTIAEKLPILDDREGPGYATVK